MNMNKIRIFYKLGILLLFVLSCSKKEVKEIKQVHEQETVKNKTINPNEYIANKKASTLNWIGRKVSSGHNGTIMLKDGYLNVSADGIIEGEFIIDMNSISVSDLQGGGKASLERHLKNETPWRIVDGFLKFTWILGAPLPLCYPSECRGRVFLNLR